MTNNQTTRHYLLLLSTFALCIWHSDPHAYLVTPKPRNILAAERGILVGNEYNALNNLNLDYATKSSSVCGSVQVRPDLDMDNYPNFGSQATYDAGEIITVDVQVDVNHHGHFEFSLCSGPNPRQACFSQTLLNVTNDNIWGTEPLWAEYPHRAMLPPQSIRSYGVFSYQVELPGNLASGEYVLKMTYVTANSCYPVGYPDYVAPASWGHIEFQSWDKCSGSPYSVPPPPEELFHNCVDVTINGNVQSSVVLTAAPVQERLPPASSPITDPMSSTPAPISSASGESNRSTLPISKIVESGARAGARLGCFHLASPTFVLICSVAYLSLFASILCT